MAIRKTLFVFVVVAAVSGGTTGAARADSPLTSTEFYKQYANHPAVRAARSAGRVDGKVAAYLMGGLPNDVKAAVVNALGWNFRGQSNGERFARAVAARRKVTFDRLDYRHFNSSQLFVLGYLLAMDDYFKMKALRPSGTGVLGATAIALLDRAARGARRDFAVQFIRSLVQGQQIMSTSFCRVYLLVDQVLVRFPPKRRNMKPAAVSSVMGYIGAYRKYCKHLRPKYDPEYNEVYDAVRFKRSVVAGTQAGVAVWDPVSGSVRDLRRQYISYTLFPTGKYVWVGAYTRVLRYDGRTFKEYLVTPAARGIKVYGGPGGAVMAMQGRSSYRYDPKQDKFILAGSHARSWYDRCYQRNGNKWSLSFMRSILCEGCGGSTLQVPLSSRMYPGRDPRRFYEDPAGRLWVTDFGTGFYYWDPKQTRFVRVAGVADKGSDVAVDIKRRRTWLLHYTRGVYLKRPGKPIRFFALPELKYLRKLHLEPNGDLWVGGISGLLRLRLSGNKLQKRSYTVVSPKGKGTGTPARKRPRRRGRR